MAKGRRCPRNMCRRRKNRAEFHRLAEHWRMQRATTGAKARISMDALRGAKAPLFHGSACGPCASNQNQERAVPSLLTKVERKVKGSGQECPLHTSGASARFAFQRSRPSRRFRIRWVRRVIALRRLSSLPAAFFARRDWGRASWPQFSM